ncbi:hypothetical protein VIGAN_02117800, partial [Vigna angularis var. angularis]
LHFPSYFFFYAKIRHCSLLRLGEVALKVVPHIFYLIHSLKKEHSHLLCLIFSLASISQLCALSSSRFQWLERSSFTITKHLPHLQIYRTIVEKYGVEYSEDEILFRYRRAYGQPWGKSRLRDKRHRRKQGITG